MKTFSKERQDEFAYYLIGNRGTFLDIGCQHPHNGNNTQALEILGWKGVLIEKRQRFINLCKNMRKNPSFCVDATSNDMISIISNHFSDKKIDYISLDVDQWSIKALERVIESGLSFKCMTFEHAVDFGDDSLDIDGRDMKSISKNILEENGYYPLFENVKLKSGKAWEDWWINPSDFPESIKNIHSIGCYYDECILKLKNHMQKGE
jgi:hypothetical protein